MAEFSLFATSDANFAGLGGINGEICPKGHLCEASAKQDASY